jgi:signal transduction histidine kinase/CheY-like chemotaxis protein
MQDIQTILKYTKKLNVIYLSEPSFIQKDIDTLSYFFNHAYVYSDIKQTFDKYIDFKQTTGYFVDIVIIDDDIKLDIYDEFYSLNRSQKIITCIKKNNIDIHSLIKAGAINFIHSPLNTNRFKHVIYKIAKDILEHKILLKYKNSYEKLKIEKDKVDNILKKKSDFFANMSHELRTPMNAIIGLSKILIDEKELSTHQFDYLNKINHSSELLLGIINDILDYSKMEAGKMSIENIDFNINMILDHIADMIGQKAKEKKLDLVFDIGHKVRSNFIGDPLRISQILLNLLSNAVKFTDFGNVTLKVRLIDSKDTTNLIQFEVSDTGIGLRDEQIQNMFQNYSQADDSISRKYGGTGLGLAISKQLTELMNGEIWVQSKYQEGSTFFVKLPLKLSKPNELRVYHLPSKELMQKRILIIDSHINTASSLSYMLGYYHMPVKSVNTLNEAVDILKSEMFDIIFVDDKIKVKSDLRTFGNNEKALIVMMNERVNDMHICPTNIEMFDIDAVLKKPFNQQMVFNAILNLYSNDENIKHEEKKRYDKNSLKTLGAQKILLAEDNTINQKVMQGLLKDTGLELVCVENGLEAYELLKKEKFNLIFMDVHMPIMDGYEATKNIRKHSAFDAIPIVAMTADVMPEDIKTIKECGMQDHLAKPIDVSFLYETIINYLKVENNHSEIKENDTNCDLISYRLYETPELDYKNTLRKIGGDKCFYNSLIIDFSQHYKNASELIESFIDKENYQKGKIYSHDMKTAAANIGAKIIFDESKHLEAAFEKKDKQLIKKQKNMFEIAMKRFIKFTEYNLNDKDINYKELSKDTYNILKKLLEASRNKKVTDISTIYEELKEENWPKGYNKELYEIINSIKQYNFKEVETKLNDMGIF